MYNEENKALRADNERDYHLLSAGDWCDPKELPLIRKDGSVFPVLCSQWWDASIQTIDVVHSLSSG